jgi:hypothetical protein
MGIDRASRRTFVKATACIAFGGVAFGCGRRSTVTSRGAEVDDYSDSPVPDETTFADPALASFVRPPAQARFIGVNLAATDLTMFVNKSRIGENHCFTLQLSTGELIRELDGHKETTAIVTLGPAVIFGGSGGWARVDKVSYETLSEFKLALDEFVSNGVEVDGATWIEIERREQLPRRSDAVNPSRLVKLAPDGSIELEIEPPGQLGRVAPGSRLWCKQRGTLFVLDSQTGSTIRQLDLESKVVSVPTPGKVWTLEDLRAGGIGSVVPVARFPSHPDLFLGGGGRWVGLLDRHGRRGHRADLPTLDIDDLSVEPTTAEPALVQSVIPDNTGGYWISFLDVDLLMHVERSPG